MFTENVSRHKLSIMFNVILIEMIIQEQMLLDDHGEGDEQEQMQVVLHENKKYYPTAEEVYRP